MNSQISREKYSYIVPEHLLLGLVKSIDLRDLFCDIDCGAIEKDLEIFLEKNVPRRGNPVETPAFLEIMERNSGKTYDPKKDRDTLECVGIILSFYTLEDSHGRYILEKHGLTKKVAMELYEVYDMFSDTPCSEKKSEEKNDFLINLTKLAADR